MTIDDMTVEEMKAIAKWCSDKEDALRQLYADFKKDTGDTETSFTEFYLAMYFECKHN